MEIIDIMELVTKADGFIHRAQDGERFTISAHGHPVAELGPIAARSWVDTAEVQELWDLAVDPTFASDIEGFSSAPLLDADLDR